MEVTVLVTTYNHEKYIAQALDSILMQEAGFPFEIVVLEDCSTDATREIVASYHRQHPDKIRLRLADRNRRSNKPFVEEFQAAPSRYIAMLDGDDYWTSPKKLEKQVAFLGDHPECSLCFHNVLRVQADGSRQAIQHNPPTQPQFSELEDILKSNFIAGCSPMFRKNAVGTFPQWYNSVPIGDWPLHILAASHGRIGYIDEILGVYRIHAGGSWSSRDRLQQLHFFIEFYETINANFAFEFDRIIAPVIAARRKELESANILIDTVETTIPTGSTLLIMGRRKQDLPCYKTRQTQLFPFPSEAKRRQFASGASGSIRVSWIAPDATYEFELYGGPSRNHRLASVIVAQNGSADSPQTSARAEAQEGAFVEACPNPLPASATPGETTIRWDTRDGSPGVVCVTVEDRRVHYPADGLEVIEQLERLKKQGSEFVLVPWDAFEFFARYPRLNKHLDETCRSLPVDPDICRIYDLRENQTQVSDSK